MIGITSLLDRTKISVDLKKCGKLSTSWKQKAVMKEIDINPLKMESIFMVFRFSSTTVCNYMMIS